MADLFDRSGDKAGGEAPASSGARPASRPLADRLRPGALGEVIGQDHLLGEGAPLAAMVAARELPSLVLWGPPGVGKTTIARLLAEATDLSFVQISAIFTGVADLRKVFDGARVRAGNGQGTLLFVDEIHRFNKAQQDGFLPHMEDGTITLVGATTENPSFELNRALLSRAQVLVLNRLETPALEAMLDRAEALEGPLPLTPEARAALVNLADGDGRALLNLAEQAFRMGPGPVDAQALAKRLTRRAAQYDKSGDGHYNLISALHKSVRGSDPDAALYWLARMIEGGRIRGSWPAASPAWRSRTSGWPIRRRWACASRPGRPMSGWAVPRGSWRWPRRWCISRSRPSRTRSTRPGSRRCRWPGSRGRARRPPISSTRRRG